jgi:transposase
MAIVVGLDVHRAQITYDALNAATGEVATGRITPADRPTLRAFLRRWAGEEVEAAVEATTGWRFVVEELQRAGAQVQLAEPADTTAARGPKRRAKTDKRDARHLRDLLLERRLPQAWIAPEHILELRALVRLRKTLVDQRTEWLQRIHAVLFHHGVRLAVSRLDGRDAHQRLAALELSPAAQRQITVALAVIEHVNSQLAPLDHDLKAFARAQPGCRALMRHYGIGPQVACAILAELGDTRRFSSSRQAVRFAGLDVTVHESDTKRRAGHLSRQGPPVLRWAAFEAAESACKPASPDHAYYLELKQRVGANRAVLSVARKLLRRAHHTLRELGDDALAPAA